MSERMTNRGSTRRPHRAVPRPDDRRPASVVEEGDRALIARDPALPGLSQVLDASSLADLVAGSSPRIVAGDIVCHYLRYKPGTSLVASVRAGDEDLLVEVHRPGDEKLVKHAEHATRIGALRVRDDDRGVIVAESSADRDLPGVTVVRERFEALRPVVYKAGRRWVGVDGERVVKVHRPQRLTRVVDGHRLIGERLPTVGLRHIDHVNGIVESEFAPGSELRTLRGERRADATFRAGAALAGLHREGAPRTRRERRVCRAADAWGDRVTAPALEGAGAVVPQLMPRVHAVVAAVDAAVAGDRTLSLVHGDFSADQVIVRDDGQIVVIDLDRAGLGHPLGDLARWHAAAAVEGAGDDDMAHLVAGYESVGDVDRRLLDRFTAGALIVRLVEPFRLRQRDWPAHVERMLVRAETLAGLR